jgi:ADP-ribose pyrophosphatase
MAKWKVLKSNQVFQSGFFRLRVDECELPDQRVMPRYYVMEFPDWVNVVPVTDDGQMILIDQYRHGAGLDFLEIPGGSSHSGGEDPLVAGQRELLEETGYEAREWVHCGFHYPNPALQDNKMHTFLALGCRKTREPELDPFECLTVRSVSLQEAVELFNDGAFKHSLMSASMALGLRKLRERGLIP